MKRFFVTLAALLFSFSAFALTPEQVVVFKAALQAETDPVLVEYRTNGQTPHIKQWYDAAAAPDYIVWKTSVTQDEITQNGFDWVQVDSLTVGKARIWEWLFDNQQTAINPSKVNVRAGIDEAWTGTTAMLAVRAAVYVHCKRPASRIEKLFSTGSGTDGSPSTTVTDLSFTENDVTLALQP